MGIVEDVRTLLPDYRGITEDDIVKNPYEPLDWAIPMHKSGAKVKFCCGAVGSGKTRAIAEEIYQLALENSGSEWLVARWTLPDLKQTAMKALMSVIPTKMIAKVNKTDKMVWLLNGSVFLFRGLKDDVEDPQKLRSYEYNGAWIEEASEIERSMFTMVIQRMRAKQLISGKKSRLCAMFSFNPTNETHWLYDVCVRHPIDNSEVFYSKTRDNIKNLPEGYIEQIKSVYPPEYWPMLLEGQFGSIKTSDSVFGSDFRESLHCKEMKPESGLIMRRCWDFGFNHPSVIVFQMFPNGSHRDYKEFFGSNVFLDDFATEVVDTCKDIYPWAQWVDYGDPHGNDKKDTGKSSIQLLRDNHNIIVHSRRSEIMEGIKIMRQKLKTLIGGEPAWMIDPVGCPTLRSGMAGGYKMDIDTGKPKKEGFFEHVFDARRYGFINTAISDLQNIKNLRKSYYRPQDNMSSYRKV